MAKGKGKKFVEEESQFSKTDMQRLGVFKEGGYISIGDPYKAARSEYTTLYTCRCVSSIDKQDII